MTTATLFKPDVWTPVRLLLQWLLPPARTALPSSNSPSAQRQNAPVLIASRAIPKRAKANLDSKNKPLRIVRILESGQPRTSVGRMVISGRMADVCAELDRLAACEAA